MDITPYLKLMVEKKASDLFFTVDSPVKLKLEGHIVNVGKTLLSTEFVEGAVYGLMSDDQRQRFDDEKELDFAVELPDGSARYRVNAYRQRGRPAMVLRMVPAKIPTIPELGLPEVLGDMIMHKRGLILMVGSTGSGKSTTLAAMLDYRNEHLAGHLLTIEDPIEFYHPNKKSIISQREVGNDTLSYTRALKSSLREAPDVILIGEIRDRETMEAALELCNTGHLAVSTLHANNAHQAMERIINLFPNDMHKQLFMDLSLNMRCVISQRLIPDINGKRCAAIEIMVNTPHIADLLLRGSIEEIREAMQDSSAKGMQTFDDSLYQLFKDGRITLEEALLNADSRANLEARINFG
ncbi:MAG: PilT/PilU family type 4a pilus ATPase [Gammaproteobacteria bacterium]|nr:PilT/PilU family type 4a pilus ATPase [Gammaproteobacteria bacterium]